MNITKQQIIRVQTAMSRRCDSRDERLDFISTFLDRPITTTKDLTSVEAEELLYYVNYGTVKKENWGAFDLQNVKHKVLLSQLYTADWVRPHEVHGEVPDTERLSDFLKSPNSPVQKPLNKMSNDEVEKVIAAFNGIITSTYK